jgi:hypothetical protein
MCSNGLEKAVYVVENKGTTLYAKASKNEPTNYLYGVPDEIVCFRHVAFVL